MDRSVEKVDIEVVVSASTDVVGVSENLGRMRVELALAEEGKAEIRYFDGGLDARAQRFGWGLADAMAERALGEGGDEHWADLAHTLAPEEQSAPAPKAHQQMGLDDMFGLLHDNGAQGPRATSGPNSATVLAQVNGEQRWVKGVADVLDGCTANGWVDFLELEETDRRQTWTLVQDVARKLRESLAGEAH